MTARTVEEDVRALGYPDLAAAVTALVRAVAAAQRGESGPSGLAGVQYREPEA